MTTEPASHAPPPWLASARMYAATPAVGGLWGRLFVRLAEIAGVPLAPIAHPPPAPLEELWARADLGCAFICGFPFATWDHLLPAGPKRPRPLAAPVPSPPRYGGEPIYVTDLIVARDSRFQTVEDTFGGRLGWTVEHSHSGYNALRHHLAGYAKAGEALYRESTGPLVTPRAAIEAVLSGAVDIVPLDGYFHDLMRRHDADVVEKLRVVATTAAAPVPLLVAAASMPDETAEALSRALLSAADDKSTRPLMEALLLERFASVNVDDYAVLTARAEQAITAGYSVPA